MRLFKTTLALVLLVGVLGLAYHFSAPSPAGPSGAFDEPVLAGLPVRDVEEIRMLSMRRTQEYLLRRKPDGSWWMEEPIRDLASAGWMRAFLDVFEHSRRRPAFEAADVNDKVLLDTGLLEPRAWVEFRGRGRRLRVDIGEEDVVETGIFMGTGGAIYRVPSALHSATQVNVHDLRERSFFRAARRDVRSLAVSRGAPEEQEVLRLERAGRDAMELASPIRARTDPSVVGPFLDSVLGLRIEEFHTGRPRDLAALGLDPPLYSIAVETEAGVEQVFLGAPPDQAGVGLYAWLPSRDVYAGVGSVALQRYLEQPLESFRSRFLVPFPAASARQIRVEAAGGPGEALALVRRAGGGHDLLAPVQGPADPVEVGELLGALDELHVVEFLTEGDPPSGSGLDRPSLRLVLHSEDGGRPVEVRLGRQRPEEGGVFARREDEPWVVALSAEPLETLRRHWSVYVEKRVFTLRAHEADTVEVLAREGPADLAVVRTFRRANGRWRVEPGGEEDPDFGGVFGIATDLRARAVLEGRAQEVLEGRAPEVVLRFLLAEPVGEGFTERGTLEFYRMPGDRVAARRAGEVLVFDLYRDHANSLLALAAPR